MKIFAKKNTLGRVDFVFFLGGGWKKYGYVFLFFFWFGVEEIVETRVF